MSWKSFIASTRPETLVATCLDMKLEDVKIGGLGLGSDQWCYNVEHKRPKLLQEIKRRYCERVMIDVEDYPFSDDATIHAWVTVRKSSGKAGGERLSRQSLNQFMRGGDVPSQRQLLGT